MGRSPGAEKGVHDRVLAIDPADFTTVPGTANEKEGSLNAF